MLTSAARRSTKAGAVICKTVSPDASKSERAAAHGMLRRPSRRIIGWENIELISDRPFETWIEELKQVNDEYPDRADRLIMEEYRKVFNVIVTAAGRASMRLNAIFPARTGCPNGGWARRWGRTRRFWRRFAAG